MEGVPAPLPAVDALPQTFECRTTHTASLHDGTAHGNGPHAALLGHMTVNAHQMLSDGLHRAAVRLRDRTTAQALGVAQAQQPTIALRQRGHNPSEPLRLL